MTLKKEPFAYFAQIESVSESSKLFEDLNEKNYYYYCFKKEQCYYLFLYGQYGANLASYLMSFLKIIKELDKKKRKIRSIRGFLLHALDWIGDETAITIIKTNLEPLFWRRVEDVLRQNRKNALSEFLFKQEVLTDSSNQNFALDPHYLKLENQIQIMENEITALREELQKFAPVSSQMQPLSSSLPKMAKEFTKFEKSSLHERTIIICRGFLLNKKENMSLLEYYEGKQNPKGLFQTRGFCLPSNRISKTELYTKIEQLSIKQIEKSYKLSLSKLNESTKSKKNRSAIRT